MNAEHHDKIESIIKELEDISLNEDPKYRELINKAIDCLTQYNVENDPRNDS